MTDELERAAAMLRDATSLVVGAGAGMGVDSGLPDFRGSEGFWRAYPPLARLGLQFEECANPSLFEDRPRLAWGFYGHRIRLYRETVPHAGFTAILEMAELLDLPCQVVTSNVDGQFQAAGFDPHLVYEVHGSIHHLQCVASCSRRIWDNVHQFAVDRYSLEASGRLPQCPDCGGLARPNVLMFGDWAWDGRRSQQQRQRYLEFLSNRCGERPLFLELGAGTTIQTIRWEGRRVVGRSGRIVRINPREHHIDPPHVGLRLGAAQALNAIQEKLK